MELINDDDMTTAYKLLCLFYIHLKVMGIANISALGFNLMIVCPVIPGSLSQISKLAGKNEKKEEKRIYARKITSNVIRLDSFSVLFFLKEKSE